MNKIRFSEIKEDREWYFVEYNPPLPKYNFAMLSITTPTTASIERVVEAMESELVYWLKKYPIPVMVTAFDEVGDMYHISHKDCSHVTGFIDIETNEITTHWRLLPDDKFPTLEPDYLISVYADVPFRTQEDIKNNMQNTIKQRRIFKWLLIIWAVIIPVGILILQQFGPNWISVIAFLYSLWKAYDTWLRLVGKKKKTQRELDKETEELKMHHYHYHCELNPDGFARLMIENIENEQREKIKAEALALKSTKKPPNKN